jgi:hypothetical protein
VLQKILRNLLAAVLAVLLGAPAALASDPLPGDATAPPPDVNIFLYYNIFSDAGTLEPTHGDGYGKDTHISLNIQALRYIRTFNVDGMLAGVQAVQAYDIFLGGQELGLPFGPGRVSLSHSGGFLQPSLGAFIFPISRPATGTDLVFGFWFAPPTGHYDKYASLNLTQNLWTGEIEAGGRTTLLGNAAGRNLAIELWGEGYFYAGNSDAALVTPFGPALGRLGEQPSGEIRLYLPYQFYAPTRAAFIPGFYQSFGGKQVYTLGNGAKLDSGSRTNESQLRFMLSSFVSPHWQVLLNGQYDLVAHGGPLNREVELRVGAAF